MDVISQIVNGVYTVSLIGHFTFTDNPEFRDILEVIPKPEITQIIVQMDKVDFVDSAALGMLLLARESAEKHGKKLVISGTQGQVKRIFEMARFDQIFNFI